MRLTYTLFCFINWPSFLLIRWWSEESPLGSHDSSRRPSKTVHFQDLENRPTLIIVEDELYRRSSVDSNLYPAVKVIPPTPTTSTLVSIEEPDMMPEENFDLTKSAKLKMKWRTLSRLLQCVSGFKSSEQSLQRSMSDPELATRVRDNDSLFSESHTQHSI